MNEPMPKSLEEKRAASLVSSIGSRLVEQMIDTANHTGRSKRSRENGMFYLKAFEDRGNRLN